MSNVTYILAMALTSFLVRALPITLINKKINNRFIRSFLYYVPYVTLAIMTFPAIIQSTTTPMIGLIVFIIAIALSYKDRSMIYIALVCCAITYLIETLI